MAGWARKLASNYTAVSLKAVGIFGAANCSDFPHVIHVSLPIDDFISDQSRLNQALGDIQDTLKLLSIKAHDKVIMACNTAHLLQGDLETNLNTQLVSLIAATTDRVATSNIKRVGLLASPTTISTGLYHEALEEHGITVIAPTGAQISALETVLRNIIAMKVSLKDIQLIEHLIDRLVQKGAEAVILGCTELSTIELNTTHKVIDPLSEVVPTLIGERNGNR